jgi:hypothetical protein
VIDQVTIESALTHAVSKLEGDFGDKVLEAEGIDTMGFAEGTESVVNTAHARWPTWSLRRKRLVYLTTEIALAAFMWGVRVGEVRERRRLEVAGS